MFASAMSSNNNPYSVFSNAGFFGNTQPYGLNSFASANNWGGGYSAANNIIFGSPFQSPPPPPQNTQDDGFGMILSLLMMLLSGNNSLFNKPIRQAIPKMPPEPPTFIDTIAGDSKATVWGDPHFVGFKGDKYDVMGESGHTYNILSDSNVQFNAKFVQWQDKDATVIGEAGIKVGKHGTGISEIIFNKDGKATFNGKELKKGDTKKFDTGLKDDKGRHIRGSVTFDGKDLKVNTGEYVITLKDNGEYLDQDVHISNLGVLSDGVTPHGLLGQTGDPDRKKTDGKQGYGAQGEGAIAGKYTDYEVKSLFDDAFQFNRFGSKAQVAKKIGEGTGQNATAN